MRKHIKLRLPKLVFVSVLKNGKYIIMYCYPEWKQNNIKAINKLIGDLKVIKKRFFGGE